MLQIMRVFRGKYILVFRDSIKTRALLQALILVYDAISIFIWGIIPMACNFIDRRKGRNKFLQQEFKSILLFVSPGVLGLLVLIESADIADTDGVTVVASHVCTNLSQRSSELNGAVKVNDKVVADLAESTLLMPDIDVVGIEVLAFYSIGTVDDDIRHLPSERQAARDVSFDFFSFHIYIISIP